MIEWTRITSYTNQASSRAGGAYRMVSQQPGWVGRAAFAAFAIVIGLPILLLVLLAILAAVVVFGVLAGVNMVLAKLRGSLPRDDGRENVRVIQRSS